MLVLKACLAYNSLIVRWPGFLEADVALGDG